MLNYIEFKYLIFAICLLLYFFLICRKGCQCFTHKRHLVPVQGRLQQRCKEKDQSQGITLSESCYSVYTVFLIYINFVDH